MAIKLTRVQWRTLEAAEAGRMFAQGTDGAFIAGVGSVSSRTFDAISGLVSVGEKREGRWIGERCPIEPNSAGKAALAERRAGPANHVGRARR